MFKDSDYEVLTVSNFNRKIVKERIKKELCVGYETYSMFLYSLIFGVVIIFVFWCEEMRFLESMGLTLKDFFNHSIGWFYVYCIIFFLVIPLLYFAIKVFCIWLYVRRNVDCRRNETLTIFKGEDGHSHVFTYKYQEHKKDEVVTFRLKDIDWVLYSKTTAQLVIHLNGMDDIFMFDYFSKQLSGMLKGMGVTVIKC